MLESLIKQGRDAQQVGAWDEAIAHYETALALIPAEGDAPNRADVLRWMGIVYRDRGDLETAVEKLEQSRAIAAEGGLREKEASAMNSLALVGLAKGNLEEAADLFLQSRTIADETGDNRTVAAVDLNLGIIANIQGNVALALLSYRSALDRFRKLGDEANALRALNNMGMAHVDLGEWEAAESCYHEAVELAGRTGDAAWTGKIELNRSELHLKRRRFDAAQESIDRSLQVLHRLRAKQPIAEAYKFQGMLFRETGRPEQADTHFALSLGMAETCQDRLLQAETQLEWAVLHLEEDRKQEGILYMNRALRLFRDLKARREVLDIERRLERLKEMYLPAVQGWGAGRTEAKDPYSTGHAKRVADYATKLARELGVEGWDLTYLRIGALIHDLGNMAVPAEVLLKQDVLNEDERELMKVHTVMGESMARQLEFPDEVRPIVRSHHEQWGGAGYPDKLEGEKIPFGARIVSIADVYDALTSPRSFRKAYSGGDALEIMQKDSETLFDPSLFGVFRDMLKRGEFDV
jgi:putative nucleotidyltransferase with HDIG domain